MQSHPLHELAKLFPEMSAEEYKDLKVSLRKNGFIKTEPIVLFDGAIIDGRHRDRACRELGIEPKYMDCPLDDPLAYVIAKNFEGRRDLSASQRAAVAAELPKLKWGRHTATNEREAKLPLSDRAALLGTSVRSVKDADAVMASSPALHRAVKQGRVSVSVARKLIDVSEKDQLAIANERDDTERRRLAKTAIEKAKREPKPEPPPAEATLTATKAASKDAKRFYSVKEWGDIPKEERARIIAAGFDADSEKMNEQTGTSIEWARWSHNTVTGCLHDCPYCYARDIAERLYPQKFLPTFHPHRLAGPGNVAVPGEARKDESYKNIFANSMSDLFGQWVPADWIEATIEMARRNAKWNFLTLTKFPQRAAEFDFPKNWWMGTTVDAQARVENAEKAFAKVKCGTKWLSVEPMLEPLTFKRLDLFQWIVIGGASKSERTPAWEPDLDWIVDLHAAARTAGCRIYYKTNISFGDRQRKREFPWVTPPTTPLPKSFQYLKGMK